MEKISGKAEEALAEYLKNRFVIPDGFENDAALRNADDSFADRWKPVMERAEEAGAAEATAEYLLKGREMFHFRDPDGVRMQIYPSAAGRVPVITFRDTEDFENLAVSAAYGGKRPENLSRMGAIFLYNKSDRFIMLSSKPYSNVPAEELGLAEDDWAEKSMKIRLEHECTHYFTKQFFGSAANNLHDELIADFFGLENAFGFYKAEYFLRFLGLTGKSGGRFQVYLESLPEEVREEIRPLLEEIVRKAASGAEAWSETQAFRKMDQVQRITFLCRKNMAE
jgi:hypothetical protein